MDIIQDIFQRLLSYHTFRQNHVPLSHFVLLSNRYEQILVDCRIISVLTCLRLNDNLKVSIRILDQIVIENILKFSELFKKKHAFVSINYKFIIFHLKLTLKRCSSVCQR